MANLVKIKVVGIFFFLVMLSALLVLFDSKGIKNLRYKEWHPDSILSVSDFMQNEPLINLDGYSASIRPEIFIRETEEGGILAYAAIDRFNSWYIESDHSNNLLKHEAYHANITYIGVKLLNQKIKGQKLSYNEAIKEREKVYEMIDKLQYEYDLITNHSINIDLQNYWEFKIDSILNYGEQLDNIDRFSGATAYFSAQPNIFIMKDTFELFKVCQLERYEMKFRFISKYDMDIDTANWERNFVDYLDSLGFTDITSSQSNYNGMFMVETHCSDTVYNRKFHDRLIYDNKHEYQLTVFHPLKNQNESLYMRLTSQFFNSFALNKHDKFWKESYNRIKPKKIRDITVHKGEKGNFRKFLSSPYSNHSVIYHDPIVIGGELIIPFKSERHKSEEIDEILVILNDNKIFSQDADSTVQLVHLNLLELKKETNKIQFGYTIKSDSINEVYKFYSSIIHKYKNPQTLK